MSEFIGPYRVGPNDDENCGIYTGDAKELATAIPSESIDLIFTDPPYHKHNAYLFDILAVMASRVCKSGSLILTLSGQAALIECISYLNKYLDYYWLSSMPHSLGSVGRYHPKQIMCGSKPFLWYSKGEVLKHAYVFDTFLPKRDKRYHEWGQPVEWFIYYISKLSDSGSVILDPFVGGGAVPTACKVLGRKYLAFEIDPSVAEVARGRVRNIPFPMFVPESKQMELSL